ncbi:LAME_0H05534g1_1 [Lachancea meyersii CBS 8951]|uniref:LAME_0H05534g1_1 n=1 Tax=Lachancea meyersii CBS 8951 TaxID=1266667 RepID=A0A1G4KE82_9SACH|nr:LAME_0H05534g1_1 [Lachancea meyersii CBS 8951]
MSAQQVRRCICDVLNIDPDDAGNDWAKGRLKKLQNTTYTLYNVSLNKLMLKPHEEAARTHLCAFLAAEKLSEKYEPDLRFGSDKIPLEPRQVTKMLDIMRNTILTSSPVKSLSWSPSPKKARRSPVKNGGRFTAIDPAEMRKQLFGTPTGQRKGATPQSDTPSSDFLRGKDGTTLKDTTEGPERTPRRKLVFEMDEADDQRDVAVATKGSTYVSDQDSEEEEEEDEHEEEGEEEGPQSPSKRPSPRKLNSSPKKRFKASDFDSSSAAGVTDQRRCLLYKKYYKVTPAEVIELCNHFEIPRDLAYRILDQFFEHATYLVFPFQLVCGLILNCCQVIFNDQRRKDPRVSEYLYQKMCLLMKTPDIAEIKECMRIVRELIEGEQWFRALKVKYNYYDGVAYEEAIAIRLGNMLQRPTNIASDEQFEIWKHRLVTDLSLRDGT